MAASYFDVDGTLITTNLVHPTLFYMMNQPTPLHSFAKLGRAFIKSPWMVMAELQDRRLFNELLFTSFEGVSEDRLVALADETFKKVIKPNIYPRAREIIQTSLDKGHDVSSSRARSTSSWNASRSTSARRASSPTASRSRTASRPASSSALVVAGPEKSRLVREHAHARGHNLDECFAYSDSYSDVPMLSVVGNPAAVNPDRRLSLLANAYHWPIIHLSA